MCKNATTTNIPGMRCDCVRPCRAAAAALGLVAAIVAPAPALAQPSVESNGDSLTLNAPNGDIYVATASSSDSMGWGEMMSMMRGMDSTIASMSSTIVSQSSTIATLTGSIAKSDTVEGLAARVENLDLSTQAGFLPVFWNPTFSIAREPDHRLIV